MLFLLEININSIAKAYRLQRAAITCTVFEEILNLLNITVMKNGHIKHIACCEVQSLCRHSMIR